MLSEDQGNKCGFYGADELNKAKFATKMPFFSRKGILMCKNLLSDNLT